MKKFLLIGLLVIGMFSLTSNSSAAYNFGDFRSVTLATKAWDALSTGDLEAVLAYTNKCIELYGQQAKKMQESLSGYPEGTDDEKFSYWALNDVATSLFIQAEAYRKADMLEEAKEVYKKLVNEYTYGQAWDPKGWFWKPAEAAKEKLAMIESGSTLDFVDYSSSALTVKAWEALGKNDVESVKVYADKILELYEGKAKEMQSSLTEYPWESKDKIFSYWALNDVGTSLYILAEAYKNTGKLKEAQEAYKKLAEEYFYAQCWDPQGWFWKPAEAAQQALDGLGEI